MHQRLRLLVVAVPLFLLGLAGCDDSFQPRQISRADATTGMPPLTGTLPNGVIGDSPTR